ncbi:HAD-IG family 5'-nucleotidase [Sorangium sp. So ce854]|uniref:HAD-IG family 5'-nucleotidase n=1 Tax=Sorangium sp. So ce854 TaxID=3133322 RepID=UPI003F632E68
MFFEQLELPLGGLYPQTEPARIPRTRRVFVNRNLKLAGIDWVGFDMDYTLAIYNQTEMDNLSIQGTITKLAARGYPEDLLRHLRYPIHFPIRGLLIDKRFGHVLKMDRFKVVQRGYHGLRELTKDELRSLYQHRKIRPNTARYHWIDTLYALSEATLYAGIVDALEERGVPLDYARLFTDIRECIDEAHRDGTILDVVLSDLPRFVQRDPNLAQTLHKFRSAGKKLFLLTNSRWPFTEKMMTYLLGDAMPEYPSFRHYFDVIVVAAQKPAFFQERRPLLIRDGAETRPATPPLERGVVYEGGNLHDFEKFLNLSGDRVLYVGDHIYGDILRSKKESAWRTAMIIQEMEAEVAAHESCRREHMESAMLEGRREELEDQLRFYQQRFKDLTRKIEEEQQKKGGATNGATNGAANGAGSALVAQANGAELRIDYATSFYEAERGRTKRAVERIRGQLRAVDAEVAKLEREIARRFHPYWGSLLKEANETSSFGDQVEEYACIYTSRVSNLLAYSPLQYFRSPRDMMPHEL